MWNLCLYTQRENANKCVRFWKFSSIIDILNFHKIEKYYTLVTSVERRVFWTRQLIGETLEKKRKTGWIPTVLDGNEKKIKWVMQNYMKRKTIKKR